MYPQLEMDVFFPTSKVSVDNGNTLRPEDTDNKPELTLKDAGNDAKFTYLLVDIDCPTATPER